VRVLITFPLLVLLVLFALSNGDPIKIGLWPTDVGIVVPVSVAVMVGMAGAFLVGALFVWIGALGQRRRARRAEARVRVLDQQLETLKARISQGSATMPPPG
jgi:uncharacterized integral membrane protein